MNYTLRDPQVTQSEEIAIQADLQPPFAWLTGELTLYLLLAVVSFAARLIHLGAYPLNDVEAGQALIALEVYRGQVPAAATGYSPLMVSLNSLAFLIFGPSDVSARLGSVLLGLILVLLPLGLRRQLGQLGALAASTLFAFSASSLFWSRLTAGEMAVAVGALLILVGLVQWWAENARFGLFFSLVGLVLLLTAAPSGFTALVVLLILCALLILTNRRLFSLAQARLEQSGVTVGQAALIAAGLLGVLGTAGLFNLTGLAAISDMFNNWLSQFGLAWPAGAGYPAFLMLFFYEPVILFFGLVGAARSFGTQRIFEWALVIWLGVVIILDLLLGGRSGQILLALLPLTLLAGQSIGRLFEQLFARARLEIDGLFVGFGLVLSGFIYITLTSWSRCLLGQAGCNTAWILPVAGLVLMIALFALFWGWYGIGAAWRGLGVLALLILSLLSIGASWRLNYGPLENLPFQPMVFQPASTRLDALLSDLSRLSTEQTGDLYELNLVVVDLDRPILRWRLRDFANARYVSSFAEAENAPVILAASDAGEPVTGDYVGQDLSLISHWTLRLVTGKEWIRWYLFRFLPNHIPGSADVILWVRQGE